MAVALLPLYSSTLSSCSAFATRVADEYPSSRNCNAHRDPWGSLADYLAIHRDVKTNVKYLELPLSLCGLRPRQTPCNITCSAELIDLTSWLCL
ncbi:hypothetical protein BDZ97DRAFT_1831597 [Flammula alnicola]|nr:hypothetical protein BDZ97DRAFT_1831597 [Flammula alnicola]